MPTWMANGDLTSRPSNLELDCFMDPFSVNNVFQPLCLIVKILWYKTTVYNIPWAGSMTGWHLFEYVA